MTPKYCLLKNLINCIIMKEKKEQYKKFYDLYKKEVGITDDVKLYWCKPWDNSSAPKSKQYTQNFLDKSNKNKFFIPSFGRMDMMNDPDEFRVIDELLHPVRNEKEHRIRKDNFLTRTLVLLPKRYFVILAIVCSVLLLSIITPYTNVLISLNYFILFFLFFFFFFSK